MGVGGHAELESPGACRCTYSGAACASDWGSGAGKRGRKGRWGQTRQGSPCCFLAVPECLWTWQPGVLLPHVGERGGWQGGVVAGEEMDERFEIKRRSSSCSPRKAEMVMVCLPETWQSSGR